MRTTIDHLPLRKQRDLERIAEILHAEFADAISFKSTEWKREGRILRIVLFGSYARGGWVDEPHTKKGYLSDYDILVIVNHRKLTDFADYWYTADDRLLREETIKPTVNFIVHTMQEVNDALRKGQYFYTDIINDGILLYELSKAKPFATPQPLTPTEALETAKKHFEDKFPHAAYALKMHAYGVADNQPRDAAFMLHQAVECLYSCLLLVCTNYTPSSHNIKFLRGLAEQLDSRLIDAWPREQRSDKSRFELLKRAYVDARYSEHFTITDEELAWLKEQTTALEDITRTVCEQHLLLLESELL